MFPNKFNVSHHFEDERRYMNENNLTDLYRRMLLIRVCEEAFVEPILSREVLCPVHLCSGQEAVAVGVCQALEETDTVLGNHRSHGHYLAKTGDLQGLVSEVFCREGGCSGGKGGSMHLYHPEKGFLGSAPIVGGTVSLATGAALAAQVRGTDRVAVTFFGDGAVGEGVVYESLNFAALRKLPVVFVCENNLYATHMSIDDCRVSRDIASFVSPLGLKTTTVDGNDVEAVAEAATKAVEDCRAGEGPWFIECKTYRLRGHVGPDDNIQGTHTDIRPAAEIRQWKEKDPLHRTRSRLLEGDAANEKKLKRIEQEISDRVRDAVQRARSEAFPNPSELYDHVF